MLPVFGRDQIESVGFGYFRNAIPDGDGPISISFWASAEMVNNDGFFAQTKSYFDSLHVNMCIFSSFSNNQFQVEKVD